MAARRAKTRGRSSTPKGSGRPAKRGAKRPARSVLLALTLVGAVIVACVFAGVLLWGRRAPEPDRPGGVAIELAPGTRLSSIAPTLQGLGVIESDATFSAYVRAARLDGEVAPGPHWLRFGLSPRAIATRLRYRGRAPTVTVTVPEGATRFDWAKRLQAAGVCSEAAFERVTRDREVLLGLEIPGPSAEGYLFPATYELYEDSHPRAVLERLKREFDRRWARIVGRHAGATDRVRRELGWGERELVILASMVEREAAVDEERPIVASVFVNRLIEPAFHPKLLQSDPTAAYGCLVEREKIPSCGQFTGRVTPAMLRDEKNPYNSYRHEGLPPGPIANPGERALEAALAPARTPYFYFVAKGEHRHAFSETFEAHKARIRDAAGPQNR